jgi:SAM-dependent methyltransferase
MTLLSIVPTVQRRARKAARYLADQMVYVAARVGTREQVRRRLVGRVVERPTDLFRWSDLAGACDLDDQTRALIRSHNLSRSNIPLVRSAYLVEEAAGSHLEPLAAQLPGSDAGPIAADAITEIIRWKTIVRCREDHDDRIGRPDSYFAVAEGAMDWQWRKVIWPIIHDCDFTSTLDLGCGHGRNVERLRHLAKSIDLVDVNDSCLAACRKRFGDARDGCSFRYHKTTGNELATVADRSVTMFYSWDTMVHFDKIVFRDYMKEVARVVAPGGRAFFHYSNLGAERPNSDFMSNHGARSDMSADLFAQYAEESGLEIVFHRLSGTADGWGRDSLDCLTLAQL